jgi:hypothetical protein
MKTQNTLLQYRDVTKVKDLAEQYRIYSKGGTTKYGYKDYPHLVDEYHPHWETFSKDNNTFSVKVHIKTIDSNTNQIDSNDYIWFDLKFTKKYILATCQLAPKVKFLVLGSYMH